MYYIEVNLLVLQTHSFIVAIPDIQTVYGLSVL